MPFPHIYSFPKTDILPYWFGFTTVENVSTSEPGWQPSSRLGNRPKSCWRRRRGGWERGRRETADLRSETGDAVAGIGFATNKQTAPSSPGQPKPIHAEDGRQRGKRGEYTRMGRTRRAPDEGDREATGHEVLDPEEADMKS